MDNEEEVLYIDELELVSDDGEDEMDGFDNVENSDGINDAISDESFEPIRDDAKYIFSKHVGSVFSCDIEPKDGKLIVTGGEDDKAYVWEPETGEIILKCEGHKDSVTCVGFSSDGTYVATGDMGGVIQVWKIASKSLIWESSVEDLEWIKWHHGANVLLGGTISGDVYMWRIPTGEFKLLSGSGNKTDCGIILPDGRRAAVGYEDGSVKIFDMKTATVLHHFSEGQAHSDSLTDIDSHPDNNLVITGGSDGRAVVIKTQVGKIVSILDPKHDGMNDDEVKLASIEAVGFYRDNSLPLAATGSLSGLLSIWDISKGVERHRVKQEGGITKLIWDKNNPIIYTAGLDGSIGVYDARSGTLQGQFLGHSQGILDISLTVGSDFLVSTSYDSTARIFSVKEYQ